MAHVAALTFEQARSEVLKRVASQAEAPAVERVPLHEAAGRVLAETIRADRDYPPEPRSMRDGYAIRAAEAPGEFEIVGEVRAGEPCRFTVGPGQAVEIMTGATVPEGADAVVMIEHVHAEGARLRVPQPVEAGANISPRGSSIPHGAAAVEAGRRLTAASVAMLASVGAAEVAVYARPRVAIVATGDELVGVDEAPRPWQIRNSNSHALAAQVRQAGGEAVVLEPVRDRLEATVAALAEALKQDLVLLSGGVSAGKYDVVEQALAHFGAEIYFDRVLIQPGQPCVFGRAGRTFFFGLPGNPASTFVCFEIFARAALDLLGGMREPRLPLALAVLAEPFRHKPGLTRFLPAQMEDGARIRLIPWGGSGDIRALSLADCFLVAEPDRPAYEAGELIRVLMAS
ncbi:MAG: molybdopterin molybdenumtransferase MoeA [Bryobacteraceae bacterium]|nr:MAG: molybdopterin molybdenumtransferase MoeA [Bryobacteraceae bacterium]